MESSVRVFLRPKLVPKPQSCFRDKDVLLYLQARSWVVRSFVVAT